MLGAVLELGAILLLVLANGLLAGAEIAVVSSREPRLDRRAEEGDAAAGRALELLRSPDRFLSTVQIGITAVAVVGGAFGGVRLAESLAGLLAPLGLEPQLARRTALVVTVAAITFLMLVVGELVPKRIALRYPEVIASRLSGFMAGIARVASPLVTLLSVSTDLVLKLLPLPRRSEEDVTEEEIRSMVARARKTGVLEATEEEIVGQLFRLSDQTVGDVMTSRAEIVWLDIDAGPHAWMERLGDVAFTRYVVARGTLDRHLGYVRIHRLLTRCLRGEAMELEPVLEKVPLFPQWTTAFQLLEYFQWSGEHLALVTGPRGRVRGMVTLHDVLEGVVGEMPEPHEVREPEMVSRGDGTWLVDGLLPFELFLERLDRDPSGLPHFETVHDFVSASLGQEAGLASTFEWRGLGFEIVDLDGRRVDKVLVSE
ncbi:MAG: hemolysin family protein [Gemmatimonadota bacterium]